MSGIGAVAFVVPGFVMALGCVFLAEKLFANVRARRTKAYAAGDPELHMLAILAA